MTMFTAENRQQQQQQSCGGYGVYGGGGVEGFGGGMSHSLEGCYILSDQILMAAAAEEDHHHSTAEDDRKAESSSKDDELVITRDHEQVEQEEQEEQGWLQLGIGGGHSHRIKKLNGKNNVNENENESGRVELELMPSSSNNNNNNNNNNNSSQLMMMRSTFAPPLFPEFRAPRPVLNFETSGGGGFISPPSSSFFLQQHGISSTNYYPHQEMNWAAFRHVPIISNIGGAASSSQSSSSLTYYPRPQFQLYAAGVDMEAAAAVDFRVIPPPRRPHSGIWFMLQASQNQEKEPFLPQISKSYLRIKDGGMTIRLVIKYLVNKLRLDNESEVEITCKGQRVASFLTLEHVRDSIWSSNNPNRDFITLLPNSSTIPHIMVLHYARTSTS
ncbi:hypothetical protein ACP275_11G079000 [Erythranthe tilingii]